MNTAAIYFKGSIYEKVSEPFPSGKVAVAHALKKWEQKLTGLKSLTVIGKHNFKDAENVTGKYTTENICNAPYCD